uniref:Secreted protein n=1 Tax=Steinernema glaseri TaxID=37863 RepID=A0A1I8A7R3_9BILA
MAMPKYLTLLLSVYAYAVNGQINLGTFNLNPNGDGGLDLGFSQMANIFGFGGDRGLQLQTGRNGFNARSTGGAIVGNERIGVDSNVGVGERQGLNLGSMLQLGNRPNAVNPLGDLVNNVGRFFNSLVPHPVTQSPYGSTGVLLPEAVGATTRPDVSDRDSNSWEDGGDPEEVPVRITTEGRRGGSRTEENAGVNSAETSDTRGKKKSNKPPVLSGLVPMDEKEPKKH